MIDYTEFQCDAAVAAHLTAPSYTVVGSAVLTNANARVIPIDQVEVGRVRARGTMSTSTLSGFVDFVETFGSASDSVVFIDADAMKATAILNYSEEGYKQGHLDYKAVLTAKPTCAFDKMLKMHEAGRVQQRDFAVFLEDWAHVLIAKGADGELIDMSRAIGAVRNMRIDASVQADSQVDSMRESRSKFASIEAKSSAGNIPAYFEIIDECYKDLPERTVRMRLSVGTDGDTPQFKLNIIGIEQLQENLALDLSAAIQEKLGDDYLCFVGDFD